MKKFWNLMLAALVVLGAVACTENEENLGAAPQQGLSFEATIDLAETRTDVVFNEGTDKWDTVWTGNETLTVKSGWTLYDFKNSAENKNRFVCANDAAKDLVGKSVEIFLTHDAEHNTLNSKAGKAGGKIRVAVDSFDPANGVELQVESAFLRYSSAYEVTLNASSYIFDYNGQVRNTITLPAGEDVWVAVKAADEVTLSYSINGEKCKEKVINIAAKKIYNLGELELPKPEYKVYVYKYNTEWSNVYMYMWDDLETLILGAWPGSTAAAKETINGYEYMVWTIPTEHNGKTVSMILNNNSGTQTADFNFGVVDADKYVLLNNGMVSFIEDPNNPEPTAVDGQPSDWALVGAFSSWADKTMLTTTDANVVVLKNVPMKAAEGFLVRKPSTVWADKYGASNVNYIKANHYIVTSKDGADMCLEADGTYDIYFNITTKNLYVMTAGTDYANATQQTVNGEEPKQEEPEVTEKVVYLKPNSNWTQSNARFAAYFFGGAPGEVWVSMTAVGDGTYQVHLPEGYDYGCKIIFCRMNPSTTTNNWNNKWDQTNDLSVPTDGKNLFTVAAGAWNNASGTWSVK